MLTPKWPWGNDYEKTCRPADCAQKLVSQLLLSLMIVILRNLIPRSRQCDRSREQFRFQSLMMQLADGAVLV